MTSQRCDPVRILYACLISVFVCMGFASIPGCVSTPEGQQNSYQAFVTAGEARTSIIHSITLLNNAGFIDEDDWEDIDKAIEITGLALNLWADALLKGAPTDEAEEKFYESFESLKDIRDPALKDFSTKGPEA